MQASNKYDPSAYYSFRNGRPKKDWVKGAYAVGVTSQFILGTRASYGRYQDAVLLNSLRRQSKLYAIRNYVILADAGFDGRQIELGDIIPPVRRSWYAPCSRKNCSC
jgi:hypothetical protein